MVRSGVQGEPIAQDAQRVQLVSRILELNPSADTTFLATFNNSALAQYLAHLGRTVEPRGGASRWVRPMDTPAIVVRATDQG